jgi:PTS system mannose-specific IIA component
VLVTHGYLGKELVRVVESILGPQEGVHVLTNAEASAESLQARVESVLGDLPPGPVVVFVDLLGGSCGHVCLNVQRARPDVVVVSGVNLPMLLEFAYKRARLGADELLQEVLRKGQEGIRCLPAEASS